MLDGWEPPPLCRFRRGKTVVDSLDEMLQERDMVLEDLRFHLLRAQLENEGQL